MSGSIYDDKVRRAMFNRKSNRGLVVDVVIAGVSWIATFGHCAFNGGSWNWLAAPVGISIATAIFHWRD